MPGVFEITGVIGGILLYSFIAIVNAYTNNIQMITAEIVSNKNKVNGEIKQIRSYSDLGKKVYGTKGEVIVDILMFMTQISFCINCLYFVSNNLENMICFYTEYCGKSKMYMYILTVPTIPVALIKTYTFMSKFSLIAIMSALIGCFMTVGYFSEQIHSG